MVLSRLGRGPLISGFVFLEERSIDDGRNHCWSRTGWSLVRL
jgi:hypothetical protein